MGRNDWSKNYNNGDLIRVDESFDKHFLKRNNVTQGDYLMCTDHTGDGHHQFVRLRLADGTKHTYHADVDNPIHGYTFGEVVGSVMEKKQFHLLLGGMQVELADVIPVAITPRKWVPNITNNGICGYEYGVVIDGTLGQKTWGREVGKDKLILFKSSEKVGISLRKQQQKICEEFANLLNEMEYSVGDEK